MILSRAPMRITLGGGGTDLPFYCNKFGSSLIYGAIDKYVYITVSKRVTDDIKLNYSQTEIVKDVDKIKHPLIREALKVVGIDNRIEIHSISDIPAGTGLGSSSSFIVGLLNGLYYYKEKRISKHKLAEDASDIIMNRLKEPCGKQDQYASAFGNISHLRIKKSGKTIISPLNIPQDNITNLEEGLMLFYTGFTRRAIDVLQDQKDKVEKNEKIEERYNYYHEIQKIGKKSIKCIEKGDFRTFGELMDAHWHLKKETSKMVSNKRIDSWYKTAKDNGAIGGKIVGAGGGGILMVFAENNQKKIKKAMGKKGLIELTYKFDFDGARLVYDGNHF